MIEKSFALQNDFQEAGNNGDLFASELVHSCTSPGVIDGRFPGAQIINAELRYEIIRIKCGQGAQ